MVAGLQCPTIYKWKMTMRFQSKPEKSFCKFTSDFIEDDFALWRIERKLDNITKEDEK